MHLSVLWVLIAGVLKKRKTSTGLRVRSDSSELQAVILFASNTAIIVRLKGVLCGLANP